MKKEYLRPAIELFQLNLAVGIMSNPKQFPETPPGDQFAPGRHDGPAGL